MLSGGFITLGKEPKWTEAVELEVLPFARRYSPTSGSREGSVPAQPLLFLCELKVKSLMVQGNSHAGKPQTTATRMPWLPLPPSQC